MGTPWALAGRTLGARDVEIRTAAAHGRPTVGPVQAAPTPDHGRHLPALDGLRGVAVLLVVFSHAGNARMFLHPALDLRGTGRIGVFLFFVLSSFLLMRLALLADPADLRRLQYWRGYAARRVARVMPAYLAALAAFVLATEFTARLALRHAVLLRGDGHFWTVPVEMRWYVLLPLAVGAAALLRARPLFVAALMLLAAYGLRQVAPPDYGGRPPDHWIPLLPFVPVFLLGCAGALVYGASAGSDAAADPAPGGRPAPRNRAAWESLGWLGAGGLLWHFPSLRSALAGEPVEFMRYHLRFDALALASLALVLGTVLGAGGLRWVFERRALRFVGRVSFSLYLMHPLVIAGLVEVGQGWPEPLLLIVLVSVSLAIAWLFWRWIEQPCMRAARRL